MKKIILSLAGATLIALGSVQAQEDTTNTRQNKRQQRTEAQQKQRPQTGITREDQKTNKPSTDLSKKSDMVVIRNTELPAALKQTLSQDERYEGWENAIIYHNPATGEYIVSPRPFRFTSEGKEMPYEGQQPYKRSANKGKTYGQADSDKPANGEKAENPAGVESAKQDPNKNDPAVGSTSKQDDASTPVYGKEKTQQQNRSGQPEEDTKQPSDRYTNEAPGTSAKENDETSLEGMQEIQADEIPANLRQTLEEEIYNEWENRGKLYQHTATGDFILIMETNDGEKKTYRFDKNGQASSAPDDQE